MADNSNIYPIEKIISVFSYFTFGIVGFLYIILALIMKQGLRPFIRYHIFMSIFLSLLIYVISMVLIGIINISGFIPYLNALVGTISFILQKEFLNFGIFHFSIINLCVTGLYLYLSVGAIMGKYSYLPWVTKIINENLRN